jgi:hypothetical protein
MTFSSVYIIDQTNRNERERNEMLLSILMSHNRTIDIFIDTTEKKKKLDAHYRD